MSRRKKDGGRTNTIHALPAFEVGLYRSVHISIVLYLTWLVYYASREYDGILNIYAFEAGWKFIGSEKDISNYEWYFFYNWFYVVMPFYAGHIAITKIFEWNCKKYRKTGVLLYSGLVLVYLMGWKPLFLFSAHSIVIFVVSLTKSTKAVWTVSIALLSTLNFDYTYTLMREAICNNKEGPCFLLVYTLALIQLRYTSFCLEKCQHIVTEKAELTAIPVKEGQSDSVKDENQDRHSYTEKTGDTYAKSQDTQVKFSAKVSESTISNDFLFDKGDINVSCDRQEENMSCDKPGSEDCGYSLLDLFFYTFYLPLFFTGPVITYNIFQRQVNRPVQIHPKSVIIHFCRTLVWAFINELLLHFLYFNAIQQNVSLLRRLDLWTLAGIGYWNGQFFMSKYRVIYGLPSCIARLENLDPPQGPKCIAYIYTYTDMWKYFDRGMYSFIQRYIFFPIGGSRSGVGRQILGSAVCFLFVYVWHGSEYYVFLWTLFNFLGVLLEKAAEMIIQLSEVKKVQADYFTPASTRRFYAVATIPLFLMSVFTAFCFFGGSSVGYIFYQRYITYSTVSSWIAVFTILYCCIQSSMEFKKNMQKT